MTHLSNFSTPVDSPVASELDPALAHLFDLQYLGLARLSGSDAQSFLQGQLSNDINLLSDDTPHQLSSYCTPKGRAMAIFDVLKLEQGYGLIAPRAVLDKVLPRLRMFVMRADVQIELAEDTILLGLLVPEHSNAEALTDVHTMGAKSYQHNNDPRRLYLIAEQDSNIASYQQTAEQQLASENQWRYFNITQCIAEIFLENYEAFIPQSLNLDLSDAVNFKKGCYPGQEIIARVKYRGKPKTRMLAVRGEKQAALEIGSPIYIEGKEASAGVVSNLAFESDSMIMSITLPVTHLHEGAIYLDPERSIELSRLPCPYEITV